VGEIGIAGKPITWKVGYARLYLNTLARNHNGFTVKQNHFKPAPFKSIDHNETLWIMGATQKFLLSKNVCVAWVMGALPQFF
jgi:hypothetical protein